MMDKFFKPNSIAIIGASVKPDKVGGIILNNLLALGYHGKIYPVNPKYKQIGELKCYQAVSDIKAEVDLAAVAIPAELVPAVIKEAAEKDQPIKHFVIISAGFGETGAEGKEREECLLNLANQFGLKIIGPNCLGIINAGQRMNISFSRNNFSQGKVGLIMQSGALVTALFDLSKSESIGFSLVVSMGNKAQLDEADFLDYFKHDQSTQVIGMYLEDIKRGREFCRALREVAKIKPVVILKAGSSSKTQAAILSHTGAMAGEGAVAAEAIWQNGGIYTDNFLEFIEVIKILNSFKRPINNQVVIVTNAGGPGVMATDLMEKDKYLKLFEFSRGDQAELKQLLPANGSAENPLDLLGDAGAARYEQVLKILADIKGIGAVVAIVTPQSGTDINGIAQVIATANQNFNLPILPVIMGGEAAAAAQTIFSQNNLVNFVYPEEVIMALSRYIEMLARKKITADAVKDMNINLDRQEQAKMIWGESRQGKRNIFYFDEAARLAELYQLNAVKYYYLDRPHGFDLKFPVVMKVDSPQITHKVAQSGVALGINHAEELHKKHHEFKLKFPRQRILIQEQVPNGVELILGIKQDNNFGTVIMLAMGGLSAEILKEKIFWLLPLDQTVAEQKIKNSVIGRIIEKQKLNLAEVAGEVVKLANLANENKWIKELDINPMIFYPDKEAVIVDIKVICYPTKN